MSPISSPRSPRRSTRATRSRCSGWPAHCSPRSTHRSRNPFEPPSGGPSREEIVESFLAVPLPETSALLAAVAALSGDDLLRRRVLREIADRAHPLPGWLTDLPRAAPTRRAVEVTHALGDGDNVIIGVTFAPRGALTAVVYVDHNLGTLVKDAFVDRLDDVVDRVRAGASDDPDTVARPLAPADARVRIGDAIELGAMTFPPCKTDTWPACRPLVEWTTSLLPEGGTGYPRPDWDDEAVTDLARRFRASPFAADVADPDDLLLAAVVRHRLRARRPAALEPRRGRDPAARLDPTQDRRRRRPPRCGAGPAAGVRPVLPSRARHPRCADRADPRRDRRLRPGVPATRPLRPAAGARGLPDATGVPVSSEPGWHRGLDPRRFGDASP